MDEIVARQNDLLDEAQKYKLMIMRGLIKKSELKKYTNLIKAKQFEAALLEPGIEEDVEDALLWVDSEYVWELFVLICEKYNLSPKVFANGLRTAWTTGIGTGGIAVDLFRKVDGRLMMKEEEKQYFDALPDKVTLYRGCNIHELDYLSKKKNNGSCLGISWTTDRGIAEFFAFRFGTENRVVVSIEVEKSSIVTFFNDRNEYECIFLDIFSINPTIVTRKPTAYYQRYMDSKNNTDSMDGKNNINLDELKKLIEDLKKQNGITEEQ